jgi:DNA gyrase subunit A
MGRPAAGVKGIELAEGAEVIGAVSIPMEPDADGDLMTAQSALDANLALLTITRNGYGKRTLVDEYRVQPETGKLRSQSRGGKGRVDIRTTERNGPSAAALLVQESDDVVVVSRAGQLVRIPAASISLYGRGTQGVRVVSLNEDDTVVAAARVTERDEDSVASDTETGPEPNPADDRTG